MSPNHFTQLPVPPHYDPSKVGEVWRVPYEQRAAQAREWRVEHNIRPAGEDELKTALIAIDVQNTFCIPGFELFVGGRSGSGAVDDNRRLCEFIYRNLGAITQITATLDTHTAMQIFHPLFLVDAEGSNPPPMTLVSHEDVLAGRWKFNPAMAESLGVSPEYGQRHLEHYTAELKRRGKYDLTIWPYHVMLGSIGHALAAAVEEAIFFHTVARAAKVDFQVKGSNPLTEHYSAIGPEVLDGPDGETIARKNEPFLRELAEFDRIIIAGQAKSHCVAWTIDDLLEGIRRVAPELVSKVYLLEDCSSPVVVPGVVDYTEQADAAFRRFAEAGMHVVRSTEPMETWKTN
jgi:nicotinamidase-related amidase